MNADKIEKYNEVLKIKEKNKVTGYPFNVKNISRTLKKITLEYQLDNTFREQSNTKIGGNKSKKVIIFCI